MALLPEIPVYHGRYRDFHLRWQDLAHLYFYIGIWIVSYNALPANLHNHRTQVGILIIGVLGLWRYGWWMLNLVRSQYFGNVMYPRMRRHADAVWNAGARPSHIHFMMTTFHERPDTTHKCLQAITSELRSIGVTGTLWVGTGAPGDEKIIKEWMKSAPDAPMEVVLVRQNQPGKRIAIGVILRALCRRGIGKNDVALLLDGDSIMMQGCLQKCVSIFGAFPNISALTTDEDAYCIGPTWMQKWLTMRFAQRRMWMQSHAVSNRVLTLTGRLSAFRAEAITTEEFIRLVEADHLNHWFWGSFRFLSGDDKSTWFCLLRNRIGMTYLPDAMAYTIEYIEGNAYKRARDNILRWSGNMLRNGTRAIFLGPRIVPPYIWWCLIDQRITIWTTLIGFFTALSVTNFIQPSFLFAYILWIAATRFLMSSTLFFYSDRIRMSYPLILYINQLLLAFIKAYLVFRLPQQRWANRLDQKSGQELISQKTNRYFANYLNSLYATVLLFAVLLLTGVLYWPDLAQIF